MTPDNRTGTTIQVYGNSPDISVDVASAQVARINGTRLWNSNAAAGTLATAGPVDCLGTAAGSWKRVGDYSLNY